ncbi:major tail protein [Gottfriedia luciferensis]|nr:major tail protein [Gottfriedia luciferensis]
MAGSFKIGMKNLKYAIITENAGVETWGTPKTLAPAISGKVSPIVNSATAFADDQPLAVANAFAGCEVELETSLLSNTALVDLLGATKDATKGVVSFGKNDVAPNVALLFECALDGGITQYFALLKGQFALPEDQYNTKEDNITFNGQTIKGTFIPCNKNGAWKTQIRSDATETGTAATITAWYTTVYTG